MVIELTVNGSMRSVETNPRRTLLELLREDLGLTGTKDGCQVGECGTCTVLLDGKAVNACLVLAGQAAGREVLTIEGLSGATGLHPVQRAFLETGAVQCGFCTPGSIMAAVALLGRNPQPTDTEIREGLVGNLCRCTGYAKMVEAVRSAAMELNHG